MNIQAKYTATERRSVDKRQVMLQNICLQLAALGHKCQLGSDRSYLKIAEGLLKNYSEHRRLLADYRCPADQRIQDYLNGYLARNGVDMEVSLPGETFTLNEPGFARELSVPLDSDHHQSELLSSYRLKQGVLHNPASDRRTTKGVFHVVAGGLPVPADKKEVPVVAYARLLQLALQPPQSSLALPISSDLPNQIKIWVSLLMRPIVRPQVGEVLPQKSMEIRFFAPGSLVANLDFVESIFGNGGDPFLQENDAALDVEHWTGTTGCVILAPHLTSLTKQEVGLPHYDDASERQRKDGMCWQQADELYNDGQAFKIVCRDMQGVVVTLIADNYFGYSKKEVKSQLSYSANLCGNAEEEHAGGALAFPSFNLGESYIPSIEEGMRDYTFASVRELLGDSIDVKPEGYAVDCQYPSIILIPQNASIDMQQQKIYWQGEDGKQQSIKLLAANTYIYPSGFRVNLQKHPHAPSWRLIGTLGEGTFCHKPSTVSGGGKSEISKSIQDAIISGPIFIGDFESDLDQVDAIFNRDYNDRYEDGNGKDNRSLLSPDRSLGSVIKLLTPSLTDYTEEYNNWLLSIPDHILALVYMIKRFYKQEWGSDWRKHFSVDEVNGRPAHELKFEGRKLVTSYLRVGTHSDGRWRIYKLRQDYVAAAKVQTEDDISASTVAPIHYVRGQLNPQYKAKSVKIVTNCESRLFQRPDDSVIRGFDTQAESDLAEPGVFISNFEPLDRHAARELMEDSISLDEYSAPMRNLISDAALTLEEGQYFVASSHPRIVDGKPTLNQRYLQRRPDLANPMPLYLANLGTRLARRLSKDDPVYHPVNAVLQGRRNNPRNLKAGIRPLAVYNPIHYQELPELFMDLVCSLTGKSPSTTGAGSEGALTKGPFNSLCATADLNNALVAFILCGHDGFSSAAGYIGEQRRIDHDISMLIPEIWCRIPVAERDPQYLIYHGCLEKLEDFAHEGETIHASRLGYRITERFVHTYFGKVFDNPTIVIDEAMLKPESQSMDAYIDGIKNICEAQQRVAQAYFDDGSIEDACPPLKAVISVMAQGSYEGKTIDDPSIREMFTRNYLLKSDWYQERLRIQQRRDARLWRNNLDYIDEKLEELHPDQDEARELLIKKKAHAERVLSEVSDQAYLDKLQGTLGADWVHRDS